MKHLGDIIKLKGSEVPLVDIVTGGSPCQDLSVAGKREGLSGERSGLFMEQIRIIKEMRNECIRQLRGTDYDRSMVKPRYMVWENVSGAFSSNKGEDFRAVLEETAKIADENATIPRPEKWQPCGCIMGDGYSIAWRVHDAQFFGVPQRRKRICLLADFNGDSAPRILFELQRKTADGEAEQAVGHLGIESRPEVSAVSQGMSRNLAESREEGQETASVAGKDAEKTKWGGLYDVRISSDGTRNWRAHCYETDISRNLDTGGMNPDSNHGGVAIVENSKQAYGVVTKGNGDAFINSDTHTSLTNGGGQAGQGYPCVLEDKCLNPWDTQQRRIQPENGKANSLPSAENRYGGGESYVMQSKAYGIDQQGGKGGANYTENVAPTMASDSHGTPHAVCYGISSFESNSMKSDNPHSGIYEAETTRTLDNNGGNPACNQGGMMVVQGANWDGSQISPTLTANNAGGSQRMPDKENFNAVITYNDPKLMDAYQHHGYRESETCGTLTAEQNQTVRGDTPLIVEDKPVTVNNSSYGGYEESEISGSLKASGGDRGGAANH